MPGVTEVQAGGVTMGDGFYRDLGAPVEPALFLLTTVTSRPTPDRIIVDAGRRAIDPSQKAPDVPELWRASPASSSPPSTARSSSITIRRPRRWGDRIKIRVNYTDQAAIRN